MKLDRIVRYKALCDMPHFTKGKTYISLGEEKQCDDFILFIANDKRKIATSKRNFEPVSEKESLKTVICIYKGNKNLLTLFEEYSVYEYENKRINLPFIHRYAILTDDLSYMYLPSDCFMDIDEFNEIKNKENFHEIIKEKNLEISKKIDIALKRFDAIVDNNKKEKSDKNKIERVL